jgi:hypothetical protein
MSEAAEKLKPVLAALTAEDRAELRNYLRELDGDEPELTEEQDDPELDAMLDRRREEMLSGKVKGIPAEEVMARLRKKYAG